MLTKDDLFAIQKMFDSSRRETNARFDGMDKKLVSIDKRFDQLSNTLHKSTNDLIELITDGFNLTDKRLERLENKVFGTN